MTTKLSDSHFDFEIRDLIRSFCNKECEQTERRLQDLKGRFQRLGSQAADYHRFKNGYYLNEDLKKLSRTLTAENLFKFARLVATRLKGNYRLNGTNYIDMMEASL